MGRVANPKSDTNRRGGTAYFRDRLDSERPDLAARVDYGELSIHAAAVQAGFRKPQLTVPDNMEEAAARLFRHWGTEGARRIAEALLKMAREARQIQRRRAWSRRI